MVLRLALTLALLAGCVSTAPPPHRIVRPARPDAHLAVSWIGHATMLIQIDDRFVLTDPELEDTIGGGVSHRKVGVPIDPADFPPLDAVLISHMHFDHLSLGSLAKIEPRVRRAYLPEGGLVYLTNFASTRSTSRGGRRTTTAGCRSPRCRSTTSAAATPSTRGCTRSAGTSSGTTASPCTSPATRRTRRRTFARRATLRSIDLALLAIAPIHPRSVMKSVHMDPGEGAACVRRSRRAPHDPDALRHVRRLVRRAARGARRVRAARPRAPRRIGA